MRRAAREVAGLLGETLHRCVLHSVDTQSAALAFYSLFALAPALHAIGSVTRRLLGDDRAQGEVVRQLQGFMGPDAGLAVAAALGKAAGPGIGAGSLGVTGVVALFLGATAVFLQLQEALNRVWEVAPRPGPMYRSLLRKRLVSFALVLAVGFLLLVSLILSAGLMVLSDSLAARVPPSVALLTLGNEVLSFLVLAVLVALVYRVLPDARLGWRDVGIGAVVTSILFSVGKWLIGLVLGRPGVVSQFGIAGSMVVFLLWVYYESYILLLGAELTAVTSSRYRRRPVTPEDGATRAGQREGQALA